MEKEEEARGSSGRAEEEEEVRDGGISVEKEEEAWDSGGGVEEEDIKRALARWRWRKNSGKRMAARGCRQKANNERTLLRL